MTDTQHSKFKGQFSKRVRNYILFSFVSIVVLSNIILSTFFIYSLNQELNRNKQITLHSLTQRIDGDFGRMIQELEEITAMPRFINFLLNQKNGDFKKLISEEKFLFLENFSVSDNRGNIIGSTKEKIDYKKIDAQDLYRITQNLKPYIKIFKNIIKISVPIQYYGKAQGFLIAEFNPNILFKNINPDAEILQLHDNKILLGRPENLWVV